MEVKTLHTKLSSFKGILPFHWYGKCRHHALGVYLRLWELLLHHCELRLRKSKLHYQNPQYPLGKSWGESRSASRPRTGSTNRQALLAHTRIRSISSQNNNLLKHLTSRANEGRVSSSLDLCRVQPRQNTILRATKWVCKWKFVQMRAELNLFKLCRV